MWCDSKIKEVGSRSGLVDFIAQEKKQKQNFPKLRRFNIKAEHHMIICIKYFCKRGLTDRPSFDILPISTVRLTVDKNMF